MATPANLALTKVNALHVRELATILMNDPKADGSFGCLPWHYLSTEDHEHYKTLPRTAAGVKAGSYHCEPVPDHSMETDGRILAVVFDWMKEVSAIEGPYAPASYPWGLFLKPEAARDALCSLAFTDGADATLTPDARSRIRLMFEGRGAQDIFVHRILDSYQASLPKPAVAKSAGLLQVEAAARKAAAANIPVSAYGFFDGAEIDWEDMTGSELAQVFKQYPTASTACDGYWERTTLFPGGLKSAERQYKYCLISIRKWNHMYPTRQLASPSWAEYRAATRVRGRQYEELAKEIGFRPTPINWTFEYIIKGAWEL
jgi:hypothetical protein